MHLIDSLEFDVDLPDEERAFREQGRMQAFVRGPALRVIEEVFDEVSGPHEVLRLDRLEVDLGEVCGDDLEAQWERRLRDGLREQLRGQRWRSVSGLADGALPGAPAPAPADAGAHPAATVDGEVTCLPRADADLAVLVHFLRYGHLPWHAGMPADRRLAEWACALVAAQGTALARAIGAASATDRERMLTRLGRQLAAPARPARPRLAADGRPQAARPAGPSPTAPGAVDRPRLLAAWHAPEPPAELSTWLRAALRHDTAWLRAALGAALHDAAVRERLVQVLNPALLTSLTGLWAPQAVPLARVMLGRRTLAGAWQQATGLSWRELRPRLWECLLAAVVHGEVPAGGAPSAVQGLLQRSADPLGREVSALAAALRRGMARSASRSAAHRQVLTALDALLGRTEARARVDAMLGRGEAPDGGVDWALLLAEDPAWLGAALRRHGRDEAIRERLAERFGAAGVVDAVALLVPGETAFIAGVWEQTADWVPPATARADGPSSAPGVAAALRGFTLAFLLADRGSEFNRRSYLTHLVQRMATRQAVAPAAMVQSLTAALASRGTPVGVRAQMLRLLHAMAGADQAPTPPRRPSLPAQARADALDPAVELRARIEAALRTGGTAGQQALARLLGPAAAVPAGAAAGQRPAAGQATGVAGRPDAGSAATTATAPATASATASASATATDALRAAVRALCRDLAWRDRFLRALTPSLALGLVARLEPAQVGLVLALCPELPGRGTGAGLLASTLAAAAAAPGATTAATSLRTAGASSSAWSGTVPGRSSSTPKPSFPASAWSPAAPASLWRVWFGTWAASGGQGVDRRAVVTGWLRQVARRQGEAVQALAGRWADRLAALQSAGRLDALGRELLGWARSCAGAGAARLRPLPGRTPGAPASQPATGARVQAVGPGAPSPGAPRSAGAPWRHPMPPPAAADAGAPITVGNAGLVLLAAYLPRLFAHLRLTGPDGFVDTAAAERAVHLTQWMADGIDAPADEHALVLNKLLCGLPLHTPLGRDAAVEPAAREVATQLLQAVIAHWSALGRTSVAGLRETFLQREGRLQRREGGWQLQVAPRAFDMLLDRLPWSIAIIRLPWMEGAIHVEWR